MLLISQRERERSLGFGLVKCDGDRDEMGVGLLNVSMDDIASFGQFFGYFNLVIMKKLCVRD